MRQAGRRKKSELHFPRIIAGIFLCFREMQINAAFKDLLTQMKLSGKSLRGLSLERSNMRGLSRIYGALARRIGTVPRRGKEMRMRRRMLQSVLVLTIGLLGLSLAAPASAATKTWIADTGWWYTASNWNPAGQPQDGDDVYLTQSDAVDRTVWYYNTLHPSAVLNSLTIDATGAGTMTLSQGQDSLSAVDEYIGDVGTGTFTQTGGTNNISYRLYLGTWSSGKGSYDLSGTGILKAYDEYIGFNGGGTFTQTGGNNTINNDLELGSGAGNGGIYNLNSGSLSAVDEYIGSYGTGTFTQTGGSHTIGDFLIIGRYSDGTYNLSDGNLAANLEYIGYDGKGTFTQTGGTHTISCELFLGLNNDSHGIYNLSGTGSLWAASEIIGEDGKGSFTQTGGSHTIGDFLIIGRYSDGTYNLSDGNLSAVDEYIGSYGTGTFTQTGGTNTISGNLYLGYNFDSNGTYNLSSTGNLSVDSSEIIGYDGTGTFTQTGGTNTISGLFLGENSTGSGSYDLSGDSSLSADSEYIGDDGKGTFTQTGGTNAISNDLYLGWNSTDSNGTYGLSDGSLSANSEYIGGSGTGAFTQTGGTHTIIHYLFLSFTSTGDSTYNLSGPDSILTADSEYIGYHSTGIFTQTGGTNNIDQYLSLGSYSDGNGTYNLSGTGNLSTDEEYVGYEGTGTFTQTGGTHMVTNTLTIAVKPDSSGTYDLQEGTLNAGTVQLNSEGTFTQNGGTLDASTFNQDGGAVNGTLQNQGNFNYYSGAFNGRLLNLGWINLYADFTAGNGLENQTSFYINQNRTVTLNGSGLDNQGTLTLYGALEGNGPLVNNGTMEGGGAIGGSSGFINNGLYTPYSGAGISNTGANVNYGNIDLYNSGRLNLTGSGLTNSGTLNLTVGNQEESSPGIGMVTGTATLDNSYGGTIVGRGIISAPFSNSGGVLLVQNGTTNITQAFGNNGLIQLTDYTASLTGGAIANYGSIEGHGHVGNNIDNAGIIEAIGGTLTLSGVAVNNNVGGLMTASAGTKLLLANGMAANGTVANAGVINLTGGTFDNNNYSLTNTGQISGYGILRTGGLSNEGSMTLSGGQTTVNGEVTNQAGQTLEVAYNPALFTGDVVNEGTFRTTHTNVVFAGSFTNNGAYISDPSTNNFTTLVIGTAGYMQGETGDNFNISEDFINNSAQDTLWNTGEARLGFTGPGAHDFYLTGLDRGQNGAGYTDNFAWGILSLDSGSGLRLMDGNTEPGGALYVQSFLLGDGLSQINDITGNGLNIYYAPNASGNDYLAAGTYALAGGGYLTPIPEPGTLLLLGTGLLGLARYRRRKKG